MQKSRHDWPNARDTIVILIQTRVTWCHTDDTTDLTRETRVSSSYKPAWRDATQMPLMDALLTELKSLCYHLRCSRPSRQINACVRHGVRILATASETRLPHKCLALPSPSTTSYAHSSPTPQSPPPPRPDPHRFKLSPNCQSLP